MVPHLDGEAVGTKLGVVPYLAPRLAVVGAYAAYIIVLDVNNDAWELADEECLCIQSSCGRYYLIAWIGTLFCAFDHPASVVCLAITTAIFVQGLGPRTARGDATAGRN